MKKLLNDRKGECKMLKIGQRVFDLKTKQYGEIIDIEDNDYVVAFDGVWELQGCERISIDDKDLQLA